MNPIVYDTVFPVVGLGIIAWCLFCYRLPFGETLKSAQKIKGFGVELEVSILALFVIISFSFCFLGAYFRMQDFQTKLASSKKDLEVAEQALQKAQSMHIDVVFRLGPVNALPALADLHAEYWTEGNQSPREAIVHSGIAAGTFSIHLENVTYATHIKRLRLVEQRGTKTRSWVKDNFDPFELIFDAEVEK